jgi:antitoxin component YwqK of YwqJK toxin-antitoxin module
MKNGVTEKYFIMYHREGQEPHNAQGERHGLWILYWHDGGLCSRTNYVNGERCGFREAKNLYTKRITKTYYAR